ncbi:DUF3016 domain-containing protein [Thalassotalea ganghwensis]
MKILVLLSTVTLLSFNAFAFNIQVSWSDPATFTDIKPANENKYTFTDEVKGVFEGHLQKLSEKLPKDKSLFINVSNVDLAGMITYSHSKRLRLIGQSTPPAIELSFQMIDSDNTLLVSRSVKLKPKNFKFRDQRRYEKPYHHELALLTEWFDNTFAPIINN